MRQIIAEFIGTAFLLIAVVGSGIMGEALADGNTAIALLANAFATGCALYILITALAPVSGAQFNPVVTLALCLRGDQAWSRLLPYWAAQIVGGIIGVWLTHAMFAQDILQASTTARGGAHLWLAEIIATFGLLFVIFAGLRHNPAQVAPMVAAYITGAYWFTASTSFANPAVTIARGFSDTFAGISPAHVPMFIVMQVIGMGVALVIAHILFPKRAKP